MGMVSEFKKFAVKGNAIDMAVGIVIGVAFGKIISSLVKDVIMPPIGLLLGGADFSELFIDLSGKGYATLAAAQEAGAATLNYGMFINTVIEFVIIAFAIFLVIRQINRMKTPAAVTKKDCQYCMSKIPIKATRCPNCTSQLKK